MNYGYVGSGIGVQITENVKYVTLKEFFHKIVKKIVK